MRRGAEGPGRAMDRRDFLRIGAGGVIGAGGLGLLPGALDAFGSQEEATRLVILHTNDTHSRIDPFPMDGGRMQGMGGVARRAALVDQIRAENPNVLLLDSGDIFQGTPYFNFFGGEVEFRAMSMMGYDVATLGNHDFDLGIDGLINALPHAEFEFVSANYAVEGTALEPHVRPWTIRDVGGVRVGIFGLGIELDRLVPEPLFSGVRYSDPIAAARRSCGELRDEGCALVICLSHLGYQYPGSKVSDTVLAQAVPEIDLILGGHTHTFMDRPDRYPDPSGAPRETLVHQVGWGGVRLGRIDVVFDPAGEVGETVASGYDVSTVAPMRRG